MNALGNKIGNNLLKLEILLLLLVRNKSNMMTWKRYTIIWWFNLKNYKMMYNVYKIKVPHK